MSGCSCRLLLLASRVNFRHGGQFSQHGLVLEMPGTARDAQPSAVAAPNEPTRRRLYDNVTPLCNCPARPRRSISTGLADQGLLDVVHERSSDRTGPGA